MFARQDQEMLTKKVVDKFATDAEDAAACRDKFMMVHGIECEDKRTQKRKAWRVKDSSACAFGTLQDLIYTWYNMNVTLPEESYHQATLHAPDRHHPLPYLPESLRVKLYPSLATARVATIKQKCQFVGALPPHPRIKTELYGRPVELSVFIKIQNQNSRRVAIEVFRQYLDEEARKKERLSANDMKLDSVRQIIAWVHSEMKPEYMRPQQEVTLKPEDDLRHISLSAHNLDYVSHSADPGPYKMKKAISGTVRPTKLMALFEGANMGPETIFLDIGSGLGEPMIAAASGFKVQLAIGIEVHKNRVEASIRNFLQKGVSRAFPIHASLEEICHYDPVTHVYCYTYGMDSCARNCIRESILSSKSVQYVMTDRKDLLRYESNEASHFVQKSTVVLTMAGSKETRKFYILERACERTPRNLQAEVGFHPIFALPIYMLRFDHAQERAFLMEYMHMLSKVDYKPLYFCAAKSSTPRVARLKRKIRSPPPSFLDCYPKNCFYSSTTELHSVPATSGISHSYT